MSPGQLRTATFSAGKRKELGEAVQSARRAAGHRWRPSFLLAHPNVGARSLAAVERGEAGVGIAALEEIGQALSEEHPGKWTKDTPRQILLGDPAPDLSVRATASENDPVARLMELTVLDDDYLDAAAQAMDDRSFGEVAKKILDVRRRAQEITRDVEQSIAERRKSNPGSKKVIEFPPPR